MVGGAGLSRFYRRLNVSYVLVTPIRNEVTNLENLVESVFKQTIKPVLWVIAVDSNCVDGSYEAAYRMLKGVHPCLGAATG